MEGQQRSTAPKGQDLPGWNDPPKFMNTGIPPVVGPTKLKLNKRVAFPLQNSPGTQIDTNNATNRLISNQLPPMMQTTQIVKPPSVVADNLNSNVRNTDTYQRDCTIQFLEHSVMCLNDQQKKEDINKKLQLMKIMWSENKLSSEAAQKLIRVVEAIKSKSFTTAKEIHTDFKNTEIDCGDWIDAIKEIISITKNDFNSTSNKTNTSKSKIGPVIHI